MFCFEFSDDDIDLVIADDHMDVVRLAKADYLLQRGDI